MKKNIIFLLLSLVIVISLAMVGCSSTPSSTPPPSTTAPASTTAPPASTTAPATTTTAPPATTTSSPSTTSTPANVITLKYSDQNPADGWQQVHGTIPWLNQITQATHGQVQFQTYFSQTLNKGPDTWTAVQNGTADMGWMFPGYWAGMMPLGDVMTLPFLPYTSAEQAAGIFWQLYEKYPTLASEYKDNHVLVGWASGPFFLVTTKKQVKTPADIKGLKIRVPAGPPTDMMKALGAVPMVVGMPDTYLDLQKGVIDGMTDDWTALMSFKHYEVVKYYNYLPFYRSYFVIAMNNDKWNSLSPAVQQEINSVSGLQGSLFLGHNWSDTGEDAGHADVKQQGYPMVEYTPTADVAAQWNAVAGTPVVNAWVKQMTAAGHPEAQDILNTELNLIKTYTPPTLSSTPSPSANPNIPATPNPS